MWGFMDKPWWMDELIDRMYRWMIRRMEGRMNEWIDGLTYGWIE